MICLQVLLVILVVPFSEKYHLNLFALEAKKVDPDQEKSSTMALETQFTGKKKNEGV